MNDTQQNSGGGVITATGGNNQQNASVRNYKAPPAFFDGMNYADWKMDIQLWRGFTSLPAEKQGTALLLELKEGKVKSAGDNCDKGTDGLDQILEQLDKIYEEDSTHVFYRLYCKFEKFERPDSMNLQNYPAEFEKLLSDLKGQKIELP